MNGSGLALISILVIALLAVAVGTTQLQAQKDEQLKVMTEDYHKAVEVGATTNGLRETAVVERDDAQKRASDFQKQADGLQAQVNTLNEEKANLQTQYSNLQSEKANLQSLFTNLQSEKDNLQSQFTNLQSEKDSLQKQYATLQSEKDGLQSQVTTLQSEKTSLQSDNSTLQTKNTVLQITNTEQASKYAQLQEKVSGPQTVLYSPKSYGDANNPIATTGNINNGQKALCVIVPTGETAIPWALSVALGMGVMMMVGGVGYALYSQDPNRKYTLRLTRDQMKEFARWQRERGKRAA